MRRLFFIRKDLNLSPGKLAAMVGHAAELYWIKLLTTNNNGDDISVPAYGLIPGYRSIDIKVKDKIYFDYITGIYKKIILGVKNLNQLKKINDRCLSSGLIEDKGYGFINDQCLTELKPENEDGTTTVGLWTCPLEDEVAASISKGIRLYE